MKLLGEEMKVNVLYKQYNRMIIYEEKSLCAWWSSPLYIDKYFKASEFHSALITLNAVGLDALYSAEQALNRNINILPLFLVSFTILQ